MSTVIETHYVPTFKNNVELLAQQTQSILEPFVETQPCEGLAAAVRDQYGSVTARRKVERHEDTKYSDTPRARRWLSPIEFYTSELYDESDLMRMLTDPQSPLVRAHVAAMNRAKDSVILQAFFAAAPIGEQFTAGATVAYDTNNDIATDVDLPGTPSGLTPFKLIKGTGRLMRNQVDTSAEKPTCVINTKAWEDMFGQAQYISSDFNSGKPLTSAPRAIDYGGFNLVQIEHADFPVNGTTDWQLPAFVKSGVVLGKWMERKVEVQRLPNKVSSWEVKVRESFAAVRVEEAKVARIRIKFS
jgi:hypothetical protein